MLETTTTNTTPASVPPPAEQEPTDPRARRVLKTVRGVITALDDESAALDWQQRDELIEMLREAVRELRLM